MKYYKQRFHLMTFAWATTLVAAACFYCAAEKPADTKLPVKATAIQGNTLYASGQDQTVALQNLYAQAHDGDTIVLQPLYGQQFVFSGSVSWDAGKLVNIEATGAVISGGTNMISWGAPVGKRVGGLYLHGGSWYCKLNLHNLGYSEIRPMNIVGGLVITADDGCAAPYNSIKAVGGINGNGGPAIQIVQTGSGWVNFYHFTDTMILTSGGAPLIQQTNKTPIYAPGLWLFDHCDFESPGPIYDCGLMSCHTFSDCYWEPSTPYTIGNLDAKSHVIFRDPTAGLSFLLDPRVTIEGNTPQ